MKFEKPEMEVVEFDAEDVICTSSGSCDTDFCKIVGSEYCHEE